MSVVPQIRLGSTIVSRERKRFVLQDAHATSKATIELVDVDVPELIVFLYQQCATARDRLDVRERSDS